MFKLVVFPLFFAAVSAGLIGAPLGYAHAPLAYSSPIAVAAPTVVKTAVPVATSYANTYRISQSAGVVAHAPVAYAAHAPVAYAAPASVAYAAPAIHAAPLAIAHAPLGYASHGYLH